MLRWCACCNASLRMLRVCWVFRARACMLCAVLLLSLFVSVGRPSCFSCSCCRSSLSALFSSLFSVCSWYVVFVLVFFLGLLLPSLSLPPLFACDHGLYDVSGVFVGSLLGRSLPPRFCCCFVTTCFPVLVLLLPRFCSALLPSSLLFRLSLSPLPQQSGINTRERLLVSRRYPGGCLGPVFWAMFTCLPIFADGYLLSG